VAHVYRPVERVFQSRPMISCYSGWGSMLTMHVQFFGVQTYAARLRVKILENSKSNFGFFMVHRDGAWDSQAFLIF